MRRTSSILPAVLLLAAVFAAGCSSPQKTLAVARESLTQTEKKISDRRAAGQMSAETYLEAHKAELAVRQTIEDQQAALDAGIIKKVDSRAIWALLKALSDQYLPPLPTTQPATQPGAT